MNDDMHKLERQVEAEYQAVRAYFDENASPSDERARAAVTLAMNERWFAGQQVPAPSAGTLRAVRRAIRDELRRSSPTGADSPLQRVLSACAAAALIALCVGVIRFAGSRQAPAQEQPALSIDLFVEAARGVLERDAFEERFMQELEDISAAMDSSLSTDRDEEELRSIHDQIRDLEDIGGTDGMSRTLGSSGRTLG